ncbi:hypothetical protein AB0O47_39955 [Streptomyces noursei]|uniref:hypothetical protein n=1 Tax=Streptomyces noursei TaxID=1971 RepID=UPI0034500D6A
MLAAAKLLTFRGYVRGSDYLITTSFGEERELSAPEVTAYVVGLLDAYLMVRGDVDGARRGTKTLDVLDDKYLQVLIDACKLVMPDVEPEETA